MQKKNYTYPTKFLCLMVCFAFFSNKLIGDEKADLKKCGEQISKATSYSVSITLKLYKSSKDITPMESFKGELRRQGLNFYSDLMGETYLQNESCAVYIDKSAKSITYVKSEKIKGTKKEPAADFGELNLLMDSLVNVRYSFKYIENSDKEKLISVTEKNSKKYKKYYIALDPETYLIKRIEYEYYDDSKGKNSGFYERAVISYDKFEINKKIENTAFSESKYIKVVKNKVTLTPAYAGYKLADQSK